jgi:hypothetical protein
MTTPEDESFEARQAEAGWLREWAEMSAEERAEFEKALDDYEQDARGEGER